jgi:hypothetical protein
MRRATANAISKPSSRRLQSGARGLRRPENRGAQMAECDFCTLAHCGTRTHCGSARVSEALNVIRTHLCAG